VVVNETIVIKLLRRLEEGVNVEIEVGRFLTEVAGFHHTPAYLGGVALLDGGGRAITLATAAAFVQNQGDAWSWVTSNLDRFLDQASVLTPEGLAERLGQPGGDLDFERFIATMGQRTGEMHRAFASATDDRDFEPEPVGQRDLDRWRRRAHEEADRALKAVANSTAPSGIELREKGEALQALIDRLMPDRVEANKTRLHGDFHLGQVLVVKEDVQFVDFEGEPARPLADRRAKDSPLRDVAGMLRSFDYAMWSVLLQLEATRPGSCERLLPLAQLWRDMASDAFMDGYQAAIADCPGLDAGPRERQQLLRLFLIEKACYEVNYECANRPQWLPIAAKGVLALLNAEEGSSDGRDQQS